MTFFYSCLLIVCNITFLRLYMLAYFCQPVINYFNTEGSKQIVLEAESGLGLFCLHVFSFSEFFSFGTQS